MARIRSRTPTLLRLTHGSSRSSANSQENSILRTSDLVSFNADVAALRNRAGSGAGDLEDKVRDFCDQQINLGYTPPQLRALQDEIIALSGSAATLPVAATPPPTRGAKRSGANRRSGQYLDLTACPYPHQVDAALREADAPASPAASPSSAPPAAPATYFLHPSIVAFVAYQRTVTFAVDPNNKLANERAASRFDCKGPSGRRPPERRCRPRGSTSTGFHQDLQSRCKR